MSRANVFSLEYVGPVGNCGHRDDAVATEDHDVLDGQIVSRGGVGTVDDVVDQRGRFPDHVVAGLGIAAICALLPMAAYAPCDVGVGVDGDERR